MIDRSGPLGLCLAGPVLTWVRLQLTPSTKLELTEYPITIPVQPTKTVVSFNNRRGIPEFPLLCDWLGLRPVLIAWG